MDMHSQLLVGEDFEAVTALAMKYRTHNWDLYLISPQKYK
jgi:hypothetical protein